MKLFYKFLNKNHFIDNKITLIYLILFSKKLNKIRKFIK